MNKLIYAIGIAVAATFASNTKVEHHQTKHKTEIIEETSQIDVVEATDSLKIDDTVKLP